jgi:proteic killer suppression protein
MPLGGTPRDCGASVLFSPRVTVVSGLAFGSDTLWTIISDLVIMYLVIRSFRDRATAEIFDGTDSTAARRTCPPSLWAAARRRLDQVNRVRDLRDLAIPPGNHLERLRGSRRGQHSIRINDRYRVCFRWESGDAFEVEITDYH